MSAALAQLKTELKKFGLNPVDWKIKQLKPKKYKIAHTKHSDFYFLGEIESHTLSPRWTEIRLASF